MIEGYFLPQAGGDPGPSGYRDSGYMGHTGSTSPFNPQGGIVNLGNELGGSLTPSNLQLENYMAPVQEGINQQVSSGGIGNLQGNAANTNNAAANSSEEQLQTLINYLTSLSEEEFSEIMGYDDINPFELISRMGSGYTPSWGDSRADSARSWGDDVATDWGTIRWDLLDPVFTGGDLSQQMIIGALSRELNRRLQQQGHDTGIDDGSQQQPDGSQQQDDGSQQPDTSSEDNDFLMGMQQSWEEDPTNVLGENDNEWNWFEDWYRKFRMMRGLDPYWRFKDTWFGRIFDFIWDGVQWVVKKKDKKDDKEEFPESGTNTQIPGKENPWDVGTNPLPETDVISEAPGTIDTTGSQHPDADTLPEIIEIATKGKEYWDGLNKAQQDAFRQTAPSLPKGLIPPWLLPLLGLAALSQTGGSGSGIGDPTSLQEAASRRTMQIYGDADLFDPRGGSPLTKMDPRFKNLQSFMPANEVPDFNLGYRGMPGQLYANYQGIGPLGTAGPQGNISATQPLNQGGTFQPPPPQQN